MKSSGFLPTNPPRNAPIFPRKPSCGRACRVSIENWCVFFSEKQGAESEGCVAREWSCRLGVKWLCLFLVRPSQHIISERAEEAWKPWIGSSEKTVFFMVRSVLGVVVCALAIKIAKFEIQQKYVGGGDKGDRLGGHTK